MTGAEKKIWVTLTGLPLTIKLDWPFHPSSSGADFRVLHGDTQISPKGMDTYERRRGSGDQRAAEGSGPAAD